MEKPDVDQIDGLSPAISIDQKGASRNPRSTVGTVTEIYDHLRLLFARIGIPHCPNGHAIERQTRPADRRPGPRAARRARGCSSSGRSSRTARPRATGSSRRPGGRASSASGSTASMYDLADAPTLDKYKRHTIEVVVDRYVVRHAEAPEGATRGAGRPADRPRDRRRRSRIPTPARLADSIETALRLGEGVVLIAPAPRDGEPPDVRGAALQRALQLPVRRLHDRRARAAQLLVQLAARRLPDLHRPRHAARDRPGPRHPGPVEEPRDGALVPWAQDADRRVVAAEDPRGDLRGARLGLQGAGPRPAARGDRATCSTRRRTRRSSSATGTSAARTRTRRRSRASSRTSSGATARPTRSTSRPSSRSSWSAAVPDLRRQAAAARGPRRSRSTSGTSRTSRRCRSPTRSRWATALGATLTERERTIARQVLKEIVARLGFLVDVGLDYLTLDRTSVDAVGRRGAADPAGDPDRDDA